MNQIATILGMDTKDWLMLIAVLVGPILAVQAQKWVEVAREKRNRKLWIFQTLMATRAARLSAEHVQALNMIDLVFFGRKFFGQNIKTLAERAVCEKWKEYLDHLGTSFTNDTLGAWNQRGNDIFTELLFAIAQSVDYRFDKVSLSKGIYSPRAHGETEDEQLLIRKLLLKILAGEQAIKMDITSIPQTKSS